MVIDSVEFYLNNNINNFQNEQKIHKTETFANIKLRTK